jgi:hypothetical protein
MNEKIQNSAACDSPSIHKARTPASSKEKNNQPSVLATLVLPFELSG